MLRALLLGERPGKDLGVSYVREGSFEAVVLGSAGIGAFLRYDFPELLTALLQGQTAYLWLPGLEHRQLGPEGCPALYGACLARERELAQWGAIALRDGPKAPLITAEKAQFCLRAGSLPPENARLTPLARDYLGGKQ